MADATVTVVTAAQGIWFDGKMLHVAGVLAISAAPDTYPAGPVGLTVDLHDPLIKAQRAPLFVDVKSTNGNIYSFVPGTTNRNGKLHLFSALNTEVAGSAQIPAGNSGDTIYFHAYFLGQN